MSKGPVPGPRLAISILSLDVGVVVTKKEIKGRAHRRNMDTMSPVEVVCPPENRPFGDLFGSRITGKERDVETNNDYFLARYYNSDTGRFLSPDWSAKFEPVPYAKLDDPQTLNLYLYVLNNPLSGADLDGHDWKGIVQKAQKWASDNPRTWSAVKATGAGVVTAGLVVGVVATAPVSVPASLTAAAVSAAVTATGTIAATGGAVATVTYIAAAISGDKRVDEAADKVQTLTSPAGYAATVFSNGNTNAGGLAANVSDLATGDPASRVSAAVSLTGAALSSAASRAGHVQVEQPPIDTKKNPDTVFPSR